MECNIFGDCDHYSGLPDVLHWLSRPEQEEVFAKDYGDGLGSIAVVLVCSQLMDGFKPRIRHAKKAKRLSMDIILNFNQFVGLTAGTRKKHVVEALLEDVPRIVTKYNFDNFNTELFVSDFKEYYSGLSAELPQSSVIVAS